MHKLDASQPIGIFDSGIGGLTVANAIVRYLPNEEIIYFGDTAHLPYGDKSLDAIRYYSLRIAKFLQEKNCKMIVVACNSAATAANEVLRHFYQDQLLIVNVVDPLIEAAVQQGYKKVGIIATKATVASKVYPQNFAKADPSIEVVTQATPLLVPMIEEGYVHNDISTPVIHKYLSNPIFDGIEALLLSCTHYPLIKPEIEDFYQGSVKVLDSTDIVAIKVKAELEKHHLLNDRIRRPHQFFVSDYTQSFEDTTRLFYKEEIHLEPAHIWGEIN